jgi:multidrug efflux pump subunit AcrB
VEGADANRALQDVKNAVDRVGFLPEEAERPVIGLRQEQSDVGWMVVYGPLDERQIFELTDRIQQDLLALPEISHVEVLLARGPEIGIEVSQATLRSLGITLEGVARVVRDSARDVPAGGVRTPSGEVLLRTRERRDFASEYGDIPLVSTETGAKVRLLDVARIRDGFEDHPVSNRFDGGRGVFLRVYETGDQKPLEIARAVADYVATLRTSLPAGVDVYMLRDRAEEYRDRLRLLARNGVIGLVLVLCVLGLFLEARLASWVAVGIPTTIAGSMLLLPWLDASINMISLFGFIVTLGIVVDDAVIVGENVFHRMQEGMPRLQAAVRGAREMLVPVSFAVITNIVAFLPLLFVPGETGRFFAPLPAVIIAVFAISFVEALFVLPAHLGHGRPAAVRSPWLARVDRIQQRSSRAFERWCEERAVPMLQACVARRVVTLCALGAALALCAAWWESGRVAYTFNPVVTGLRVDAEVQTPLGSAFENTVRLAEHVEAAAIRAAARFGDPEQLLRGRMNVVGRKGENWADVTVFLAPQDERDFGQGEFASAWREEVGDVAGLESLYFEWEEGPGSGAGLTIQLSHPDRDHLEAAAESLAAQLGTLRGVTDIKDGLPAGKVQIDVALTPEGRSLGLTSEAVGRQVRHAFYGAEALRLQRGRHEVKVMVRLPESERRSLADVEGLILRAPTGGEVPLSQAARLGVGRAYTEITHVDGRRVLNVTANVLPELANVGDVRRALERSILPALVAEHSGLAAEFSGRQREERRAMDRLRSGLWVALAVVFALLAGLFRSYGQALIVMAAIPFAVAAALLGHVLLGYDLSVVSVFGMIALGGLSVNAGLVLTQETNRLLAEGMPLAEASVAAARRRLRPILLTSLTTFAGLAPMIFETSAQARFLVPMAIALGFGVLLSAPVVLVLTPVLRLIAADLTSAWERRRAAAASP